MSSVSGWTRFDKHNPCPICEGDAPCARAPSGCYLCWRTHDNVSGFRYVGESKNDPVCGMFFSEDDWQARPLEPTYSPHRAEKADPAAQARAVEAHRAAAAEIAAQVMSAVIDDDLGELPQLLRIPAEGLLRLGARMLPPMSIPHPMRHDSRCQHWVFPSRDETGRIIGTIQRFVWKHDGKDKFSTKSTTPGVNYDPQTDWSTVKLLAIPEGGSDTAALLSAGIDAIGRPSNTGGGDILAAMMPLIRPDCRVVVMAENDEHTNSRGQTVWPGKEGAEKIARRLADVLGRTVYIWYPNDSSKDCRDYLANQAILSGSYEMAGLGLRYDLEHGHDQTPVYPDWKIDLDPADNGTAEAGDTLSSKPTPVEAPLSWPGIDWERPPEYAEILGAQDRRPCPDAANPVLQSKSNPHELAIICRGCGCWRCQQCQTVQRAAWAQHMAETILPDADTLYVGTVPGSRKVRKQASLLGAEYLTVSQADGTQYVLSDQPLSGLVSADRTEALRSLCVALQSMPLVPPSAKPWKPIKSSQAWARSRNQQRSDKWNVVGTVAGSMLPAVERTLRERSDKGDIAALKEPYAGAWRWNLFLPRWWPAAAVAAFVMFGMADATFDPTSGPEIVITSPFDNQPDPHQRR